jgi:hypothetical protein
MSDTTATTDSSSPAVQRIVMWCAYGLAFALIVATRIEGLHLTEGEIWVEYWHRWLVAVLLLGVGFAVSSNT